jgi:hypothetical protein
LLSRRGIGSDALALRRLALKSLFFLVAPTVLLEAPELAKIEQK